MRSLRLLSILIFFASLVLTGLVHAACIPNFTPDAQGFAPSLVKEPDGRGTATIIYSTSLSLFLCAWTSLHLNIPRTDETVPQMIWQFFKWGLLSFLAPEFVIFIALLQLLRARKFRGQLNVVLAQYEKECREKVEVKGKDFKPFTMLYAWFALMGGFSIDTSKLHNSLPVATLGLDGIIFLARRGHFFRLPDAQISDKSKADYLAKGIVVVQVLWFVCAGLTRKFAGLPISLLEYHAFVNIGCAIATYILWFKKPLAIKTPTIESPANKEQLIAAMLFMAELKEKPKFVLEEALSPRRAPAEKWLWSWVPNKPSLTINAHIPEHIFERIPEVTVQIKPANHEEGVKTERGRDIVSHLEEPSCFLECGCPWSDRDGLHRCNTTRPGWNVHLSKKDRRRLDLVRQYIEAQHGIRPRVTIITPQSFPVRNEPQLPPFISPNRHQQAQPAPRRPTSHISIPSSSSYAASSDLEMQNLESERGRPTTLPPNFRTQEYLDSLRDSRQGMPVHRIWCLQEIPSNSIYTILPNFNTSDVLDYGFTRLSKWRWWLAVTALLIVPSGYGAAHLYPVLTHYNFPTGCERQMWWISCIFIMTILAGPLAFAALKSLLSWVSRATSSDPITRRGRKIEQRKQRVLKRLLLGLASVYFAFWLTARLYLIVESFASLRRVRAEIFETPQWNWLNYIPHI